MSFNLCTSQAILMYCGKNVSASGAASSAMLAEFADQAEGYVCALTRYDWVTNSAAITTVYKPILAMATSAFAANGIIQYDMSGYTSRGEAEDLINLNYDRTAKAIKSLVDDTFKTKMGAVDT